MFSRVAFAFILICCHHALAFQPNGRWLSLDLKEQTRVEKILEDLKIVLRTGNSTLGIPVLDPFHVDRVPIDVDEDEGKVQGELTNVNVKGISNYKVHNGDFQINGFKLTASLTWPRVEADTNYQIKGEVNNFPIHGNGMISAVPQDFFFSVDLGLGINDEYLVVESLDVDFSLKALKFKITGLMDDEELSEMVSGIISDMAPRVISENKEMIKENVLPVAKERLNAVLGTRTLLEWLKLLS